MSQTTNPSLGDQVTFLELFNRHPTVEVPIIQRDYVQGRASELEVRTEFLEALHAALSKPAGDPSLPLNLDFVYGSIEGPAQQMFCPLDGQQRLTTLFLLHWYLAWKDGRMAHLASCIASGQKSRFSYKVRSSSQEFFDGLVGWHPGTTPQMIQSLSETIKDQPWFYLSWTLDPTIQSCLNMLDDIHKTFRLADGWYDRLMTTDNPHITFQLLDLRSFGLSDDLYIKMNARGKPLTPFEAFKARLEQHLDSLFSGENRALHGIQVSVKDYFSHRIDTAWTDLFWMYRDAKTHLFDDRFMHLIRALALITRDPDSKDVERVLQNLRDSELSFSFFKYQEQQCIDRPLIETLIAVLDGWCEGSGRIRTYLRDTDHYDEKRAFENVITVSTKLPYEELVQFHAYCAYIRKHRHDLHAEKFRFGEWMRVIRNLAVNTTYDQVDDFRRSIRSVNELLNQSDDILDHLSDTNVEVRGFNEQQIREEKLKAQLIHRSDAWRSLILKAEQHGYFKGQIEFLFKFSGVLDYWVGSNSSDWSESVDAAYQQAFAAYFAKASAVFSATGLNVFGEYRWERALLSIGDYLLPKGSNHSTLDNSDRDASWKRLLRGSIKADDPIETNRQFVKDLFDRLDPDIGVEASLDVVIGQADLTDEWRRVMVDKHEMMEFCGNRMIRWQSPDRVYLLRKIRMSGEHAELFTYALKVGLLSSMCEKGKLAPFDELSYHTVNTDSYEPCARMQCRRDDWTIVMDIFNKNGDYELRLYKRDGALPAQLRARLTTSFDADEDKTMSRTVAKRAIEATIKEVVAIVREFTNVPAP